MNPHPPQLKSPQSMKPGHPTVAPARLGVERPPAPIRSARAAAVARLFALPAATGANQPRSRGTNSDPNFDIESLFRRPGQIVLLTGPSGAGKSSLLRRLRRRVMQGTGAPRWIDLARLRVPMRVPVVDCFPPGVPLINVLADLGRVGLGEAWSYLRTPTELSDGQRWRLRLALALRASSQTPEAQKPSLLVADEFGALLDRVTAIVVARCLRRSIDRAGVGVGAVIATSHDDLIDALEPDVIAACDFGRVDVIPLRRPPISIGFPSKNGC